jgi:hypothetical protein
VDAFVNRDDPIPVVVFDRKDDLSDEADGSVKLRQRLLQCMADSSSDLLSTGNVEAQRLTSTCAKKPRFFSSSIYYRFPSSSSRSMNASYMEPPVSRRKGHRISFRVATGRNVRSFFLRRNMIRRR